jgi:hypothetical protein
MPCPSRHLGPITNQQVTEANETTRTLTVELLDDQSLREAMPRLQLDTRLEQSLLPVRTEDGTPTTVQAEVSKVETGTITMADDALKRFSEVGTYNKAAACNIARS